MKPGWSIRSLIGLAAMLVVGLPSFALGEDVIAFGGRGLTDQEMAETRGGFSLKNGNFITFSFDLFDADFLVNSKNEMSEAFVNAVTSRGIITDKGMQYDVNVLKGGDMYEMFSSGDQPLNVYDIDHVAIKDSFKNITGPSNISVFAGDGNTVIQSLMMKLDIDFYGPTEIGSFSALEFMR